MADPYIAAALIDLGYVGATRTTPYRPATTEQIGALQNLYGNALLPSKTMATRRDERGSAALFQVWPPAFSTTSRSLLHKVHGATAQTERTRCLENVASRDLQAERRCGEPVGGLRRE